MRTDDLDFKLPEELIAQTPAERRSDARLLHYDRATGNIGHLRFTDLPPLLNRGDLLVFNDARVIPARFALKKATGGRIEALFLSEPSPRNWQVLLKNLGDAPEGTQLAFEDAPTLAARVEKNLGQGEYVIAISPASGTPGEQSLSPSAGFGATDGGALEILQKIGRMPLPPYIKRDKPSDPRDALDRDRYQTVFARAPGAVAAPTAGLHFSDQILEQLDLHGIERTTITLHVGLGTFKPVETDTLEAHPMHAETYEITERAAASLNRAKFESRRIIAVGTTSARVLESQPAHYPFKATTDRTSLFIFPPYRWRHVGALLTNFHLPRSTLIALVAAMTGLEQQRKIYAEAIAQKYRFFSYGDAMLID